MLAYSSLTDTQLVNLLKEGDDMAFTQIYERYWAILLRHARRMLQDDEETRDVLQDVFSTLWNDADTLQIKVSLSAYLYSLTRNRILNIMARGKVKANYLLSLDDFMENGHVPTDHRIREKQLSERIEQELALLPPKMREVFELSRKQHLSYNEIALRLHISDNTVKKQMSNALHQLRLKLGSLFLLMLIIIGR
jgi:RNA polymerase sigma-70 factor (family 1)